jgi:hypothetical protein
MTFDPATWRESIRIPILAALIVLMAVTIALGPRSGIATVMTSIVPPVVSGAIWRFERLPWIDILSWTLPLVVWIAGLMWILPSVGPIGWIVGGTSVAAWVYAFIFWTRVTRWWYRAALRKPYPGSHADSGPT